MRLPTPSQTADYFASLNARLEPEIEAGTNQSTWRLTWADGREESYSSLLDLWFKWLNYANAVISDEEAFQAFQKSYLKGDAAKRQELESWISSYYSSPMGEKSDHPDFSDLWGRPCNRLPHNWKKRLHTLLTKRKEELAFPHRAAEFLRTQRST